MSELRTDLVVLGGGPGGYAAAFRAADGGKKVVLVEREKQLGGVCARCGCIPSKAALHVASLLDESKAAVSSGITVGVSSLDLPGMRFWKNGVVEQLARGLEGLAQRRGVQRIMGTGTFVGPRLLRVNTAEGLRTISFDHAVIATGSRPFVPSVFNVKDRRVMTSTEALAFDDIPGDLLVVGGGYIGMELSTAYAAFGSRVVLAEALDMILAGADADLVRPVFRKAQKTFRDIRLETTVTAMTPTDSGVSVTFQNYGEEKTEQFDRVLVAVGRVPNTQGLGLEQTAVMLTDKGFIRVDDRGRTDDPAIHAVGDVVGGLMLAHKAGHDAKVAIDDLFGGEEPTKESVVPAVIFTQPEVAWCGLTEQAAKAINMTVKVARFSWAASGRALTMDKPEGLTKLVVDPGTEKVLGVGLCGTGAGELVAMGVHAVRTGATARELAETICPHPTLSETLMECAETFYGRCVHGYVPKR